MTARAKRVDAWLDAWSFTFARLWQLAAAVGLIVCAVLGLWSSAVAAVVALIVGGVALRWTRVRRDEREEKARPRAGESLTLPSFDGR